MTKKIVPLKVAFAEQGLIVRSSSGRLIEGAAVRRAKVVPDERGRLGEILRADDPWFKKFGQVYFTTTYPGVVKAWHFHKKQDDHFYVVKGTVKVALYDRREDSPTFGTVNEFYLGEHCPGIVKVPAGVYHGWMCVSQEEAYIVNIPTEPYNHSEPDEYRQDPYENDIPYGWTRKDG